MKYFYKKIIGFFLSIVVTNSLICKEIKYKYNANNGFFTDRGQSYLYWEKEGYLNMMILSSGECFYNYEIPKDINVTKIIGNIPTYGSPWEFICVNENTIETHGSEKDSKTETFENLRIPKNYSSIIPVIASGGFYPSIVTLTGKRLIVYYEYLDETTEECVWHNKQYELSKEYESAFLLGNSRFIGLVDKNEIDIIKINIQNKEKYQYYDENDAEKDEGDYEFGKWYTTHIILNKQYDAYVGCSFEYKGEKWPNFKDKGRIEYIGCIENNSIKFYDILIREFARDPETGKEIIYTF